MKTLNVFIEIYTGKGANYYPSVMLKKPIKREIENGREFGYKIYKCKIIYDNKKPL